MTATIDIDQDVAVVVTEHTWQRCDNIAAIARVRKDKPEPITTTCTFRIGHRLADCAHALDLEGKLVGRDVATSTVEAGTLCDYCWPSGAWDRTWKDPAAEAKPRVLPQPSAQPHVQQYVEIVDVGAAPEPAQDARPWNPTEVPAGWNLLDKANRFGGPCVACGSHVADGSGRLARNPRTGKFGSIHRDGDCRPNEGRAAGVDAQGGPLPDVPAGHYAIESHGENDLMFVRVDRPEEGQYAGRTFVKMIVGGHPDAPVRGVARVRSILERIIAAGVAEAGARYGREIGRCCRCNRSLTDDESRAAGIGPECRKKA